jgi:AraC-like DNA-binding protein
VACGYADLEAPWVVEQRQTGRHWLYVVQQGSCWIQLVEESRGPIQIKVGDAFAVANDSPHFLRHAKVAAAAHPPSALAIRTSPFGEKRVERARTVLFLASVACDAAALSDLFPTILYVPGDGSRSSARIAELMRMMEEEISADAQVRAEAALDRLGDLVLIELLRFETRRVDQANPVWLQGIADPTVARLVTHLHAEPATHWTWESMSRVAGLSKSALDRHFRAVLGQSPKRYLLGLRMRLAVAALAEGRQSIDEIATSIGYESGPAFHRAFRRTLGLTPGRYARLLDGTHPARDGPAPS